jgi:hypothetical protein
MSDPNAPPTRRPDGMAEAPPPSRPPSGDAARRDVLVGHFKQHERGYTRFALDRAARSAGYSDSEIADAWSVIDMQASGVAGAGRFATMARLIVLGLYVATFLLFVFGSNMAARTYGVGVPILAVTLFIVGGIALLRIDRAKVVSRDPLAAYASLLAVPFVLLVIVAGLCIGTTSPTFFGPSSVPGPTPAPEEVQPEAPAETAP